MFHRVILIFLALCLANQGGAWAAGSRLPLGWNSWSNGAGLSVALPPGWQASPATQDGWVKIRGPKNETIVIGPLLVKGALAPQGAGAVLNQLAAIAGGRQDWSAPQPTGAQSMQMVGSGRGALSIATLHWAPSQAGTAAMFTFVAAEEATLRMDADLLNTLLASVALRNESKTPPAQATGPRLIFTTWRDPKEGSFTVEVPTGWQVQGGAARYSSVDIRAGVLAVSPDAEAVAVLGDTQVVRQMRQVPNQVTAKMGLREGQSVPNSYGPSQPLQRYLPGALAAQEFARIRIPQLTSGRCQQVAVDQSRDMADVAAPTNAAVAVFRQQGILMHADAGAVEFHCANGWTGSVMAQTMVIQVGANGLTTWYIDELSAAVAEPAHATLARAAQARMLASYRLDPGWEARQQQTTMKTSAIVSKTQAQISQTIHELISEAGGGA